MPRLMDSIDAPSDLNSLSELQLVDLCGELRQEVIEVITEIGGHLSASLGVVELTVALHRIFNSPKDVFCWDVGHQAYIHKLLTGRRDRFSTIRQYGGLSGFLKRSESEHDHFGAGHASTSISAALGFAEAARMQQDDHDVVAVIGDGAMTGGMAFEALNNAGASNANLLVVLNDNKMSISPNVGALSRTFTEMTTNPQLNRVRDKLWDALGHLPGGTGKLARELGHRLEESLHSIVSPGLIFDEMGFRYFGPIDGHDLPQMMHLLSRIREMKGPRLLHVLTRKGKGLAEAEANPVKFHGVGARVTPVSSLQPTKPPADRPKADSYNNLLPFILSEAIESDSRIVAVTAAMAEGTGLAQLAATLPDRVMDVGIAEGHGVTFSAGLAAGGMRPVVCIYSTFLQRAIDSIMHDVVLQHLPVIFMLDRSGLVGADGPTHHGTLDIPYLSMIPELIVAAPKDGNELRQLFHTAREAECPFAIRYPKDNSFRFDPEAPLKALPIGSWEDLGPEGSICILAVGSMVQEALEARDELSASGKIVRIINARFIRPLDLDMLRQLADSATTIITLEEGTVVNGFGSMVGAALQGMAFNGKLLNWGLPDGWVEHGERRLLLDLVHLSAPRLVERLVKLI
jgi:1-deoxy-D-xylulose-5-phosphate synthase